MVTSIRRDPISVRRSFHRWNALASEVANVETLHAAEQLHVLAPVSLIGGNCIVVRCALLLAHHRLDLTVFGLRTRPTHSSLRQLHKWRRPSFSHTTLSSNPVLLLAAVVVSALGSTTRL